MQSNLDLHMHSNHSLDGKLDVNIILDKCAEANIKVVSITDHDSCDVYLDIDKTILKEQSFMVWKPIH